MAMVFRIGNTDTYVKLTKKSEERLKDYVLDAIADAIFTRSQENLLEFNKVDTGFLLRSGNVIRKSKSRAIVYSAPYATDVEFGSYPHYPPLADIHAWVKRRLGVRGKKESMRIARAIVAKIGREGTAPVQFMRKAIDLIKNNPKYVMRFLR